MGITRKSHADHMGVTFFAPLLRNRVIYGAEQVLWESQKNRMPIVCRTHAERMPTHGSHMSTVMRSAYVRHAIGMRSTYDTHEIVMQTLYTVIHLYIRYGNFNGITGENDLETISPDLHGELRLPGRTTTVRWCYAFRLAMVCH
jgi:hypothetical protein